jgi:tRNA(fMet)-specific endonuclease VapC
MESSILGLVVDSGVLIAAERRNMTAAQAIEDIHNRVGECPIVLSAITVAEIGHGIYRANTPELRNRRRAFLDDLKSTVPIYPITASTCEIMARVGAEQASKGINLPVADLMIGACALELGYAIGTNNRRDFARIPDLILVSLLNL